VPKKSSKRDQDVYKRLIDIGLRDPFVQIIAGLVVVAVVANFAISTLGGSGPKALIIIALTVMGGVVLFVLRTLTTSANSIFVKIVGYVALSVIMLVVLIFVLLLIPVATMCWPQPYAELLTLPRCVVAPLASSPGFKVIPYAGADITTNSENQKYLVLVFYRPDRLENAGRIVGALRKAGYRSDGFASGLDEVVASDKRPGTSLIKTTTLARPIVDDVNRVVRLAIPENIEFLSVLPEDAPLQRGNVQVDLF